MLEDPVLVNDWHVVARSEDIQKDRTSAARLLREDLVLWRCGGEVKVWQDLCVHRGTRLSLGWIRDETLTCSYHGWTYDDEGKCVRIPAHADQKPPQTARVKTYRAKERYGFVWACLGEPRTDIPEIPQLDNPSYTKIFCGPYRYKASGPRAIENAPSGSGGSCYSTDFSNLPISAGLRVTLIPHSSITASFSCAVPLPPEMIAPAWPMRFPGGAVTPAMKPTTGFFI